MKKITFAKIKPGMIINLTDEAFESIQNISEVKLIEKKLGTPVEKYGEVGKVMPGSEMLEIYLYIWSFRGAHFRYLIPSEWISSVVDRDKNEMYILKKNNWEWLTDWSRSLKKMFIEAKKLGLSEE